MHTSFSSGPVALEADMSLFVLWIVLRRYFLLDDVNEAIGVDYAWKPGHRVPLIGKYVLEGVGQGVKRRPSPTGLVSTSTYVSYDRTVTASSSTVVVWWGDGGVRVRAFT